jgi:hypothetical protein
MNIYQGLRIRSPSERARLIARVQKYIRDPEFIGVLHGMHVDCLASIRDGCKELRAWEGTPDMKSKITGWLRS